MQGCALPLVVLGCPVWCTKLTRLWAWYFAAGSEGSCGGVSSPCSRSAPEMRVPSFPAIPLTAYGPMAAAAAAAAVVRGTGNCHFPPQRVLARRFAMGLGVGGGGDGVGQGLHFWDLDSVVLLPPVGSTPSRTGGFLGTTSPGPMAELYGAANQDSGVSSYISAASPAPSTGFGHSLGVSVPCRALRRAGGWRAAWLGKGLHLRVAMEVSSSGWAPLSLQPVFWLNATCRSICRATAEPQSTRVVQDAAVLLQRPWAPLALPGHHSRS